MKLLSPLTLLILLLCCTFQVQAKVNIDQKLLQALRESSDDYSFEDNFEADIWLTIMSQKLAKFYPDEKKRLNFLALVHHEAKQANLNPELVLALIQTESYFERFAISRAGALGYMQIMPFWLKELDRPDENLFTSQVNIRFGCTILAHYLKREKGDLRRALGRYNGSLGRNKYPNKVIGFWKDYWYLNHWEEVYY